MNRKAISGPERTMVMRVVRFFEDEKNNLINVPVKNVLQRTSMATGISTSTVKRIRRQDRRLRAAMGIESSDTEITHPTPDGRRRNRRVPKYSKDILNGLKRIVDTYIKTHGKMMTIKDILAAAKKQLQFPGEKGALRTILGQMGYTFHSSRKKKRLEPLTLQEARPNKNLTDDSDTEIGRDPLDTSNLEPSLDTVNRVNAEAHVNPSMLCEVAITIKEEPERDEHSDKELEQDEHSRKGQFEDENST